MSTTVTTSPACALPGWIHSPGLPAWKVTVASAPTATPATSPVDASTPLGTSQATTATRAARGVDRVRSRRRPGRAGRRWSRSRGSRRRSRRGAEALGRVRLADPGREALEFVRASPRNSRRSPSSSTRTRWPSSSRWRAATKPSPPLLPLPQTTTISPARRAPPRRARARRRPAPSGRARGSRAVDRPRVERRAAPPRPGSGVS